MSDTLAQWREKLRWRQQQISLGSKEGLGESLGLAPSASQRLRPEAEALRLIGFCLAALEAESDKELEEKSRFSRT